MMRKTPIRTIGLLALILSVALFMGAAHAAPGVMQDLGTLGGDSSYTRAINDQGQVVGDSKTAGGDLHAFLWTASSGMQDLGALGGGYSEARAINDQGQVVGDSRTAGGDIHAFLWTASSGMQDLGALGGDYSYARAINDQGQVVGESSNRAFLWTASGGMQDLGTLGGNFSRAWVINEQGQVVGDSYTVGGEPHAFLWTASGGMQDLGTLGGYYSEAKAINDQGQVVGRSRTAGGDTHAFLWTASGGMQDLGDLGGGYSEARVINEQGQVAGDSRTTGGSNHVFLWTAGGGMQDLGTLGGGDNSAWAINDQGQVVGESSNRAFLWTASGGMQDLGDLGGGKSYARAINEQGQVVGHSRTAGGDTHAFLWSADQADPTLLYVDSATKHMHGLSSFQVPVRLDTSELDPDLDLSSVSFTLDYDQSCLSFDAATDSDGDGLPDAVTVYVDSFFDVTFEIGDDGGGSGGAVTLLIKPVGDTKPLPILPDGDLAAFEFGVLESCVIDNGDTLAGDKLLPFDFLVDDDPIAPSFGDTDGQAVAGATQDGEYTLFFNSTPTDMDLDPADVDENMPAGTPVGDFTTTDRDLDLPVAEGHSYSLVPDCGVDESAGNYAFDIDGVTLVTGGPFDFEVDSFFDICVRTTDAWGLHYDESFRIGVNDRNEAPADIVLDDTHVPENHGADTTVGLLSTVDEDAGDSHIYGWCGAAPAEFKLVQPPDADPAEVQLTGELDHEVQSTYNICIRTTDSGALFYEKPFTVVVDDINDAPVAVDDPASPPLIVVDDGVAVTIDVLANDTDEDDDALTLHDVTQGVNGGTVTNNGSDISYTAPAGYNGPDSFEYQIIDNGSPVGTSNWATVSLHVVADDGRADCNRDGQVDAADFPATVLEIFDTDESIAWWKTYTGEFAGSPKGCDSNGSENGLDGLQQSVDAADIICTVLIFFGDDTCSQGGLLAARAANDASLAVADLNAAAGEALAVPLVLDSGGANAAALTFVFEYDAALLSFNASDNDGDGAPDALALNVPAGMASTVMVEAGRIEVALFGTALPFPLLADGTIATVSLQVNANAGDALTMLGLDNVSLGDDQAQSVTIDAVSGRLTIGEGVALGRSIFLPVITSK